MKDIMSYRTLAKEMGLGIDQVAIFTNHGVYIIKFGEFDGFHEYMEVSRGEEGLSNEYHMAITLHNVTTNNIWEQFTNDDGERIPEGY